jgi:hypothetical protein
MSDSTTSVQNTGLVQNPAATNTSDGQDGILNLGKQNEQLVAEVHGPWYNAAMRGSLFTFNVTAKTINVISAAYVSVFALYNPASSGKIAEIVDMDMGLLVATTLADVFGVYWQGAPGSGASTFTTPSVFGTNTFGGIPGKGGNSCIPYTALTFVGTPTRIAILNSFNSSGFVLGTPIHQEINGKILLMPGDLITVATSTTVWTASAVDLAIRWAEWQLPA